MPRGLFVTGTDTGVGKTVVSAALMHRYRGVAPLRYWKPIQTGIEQDDDTAAVASLGGCTRDEVTAAGVRLRHPVSPHLAAHWSGYSITLPPLVAVLQHGAGQVRWVVEGAGGVLVPLNDRETMLDLMSQLALPVVVVARTALGTINHTLLTLEALRKRSLDPAGVVMVGHADAEARKAIEHHGRVPVVGEMPRFAHVTRDVLAVWAPQLDPADLLRRYLA